MATYKGIKGTGIDKLASDPSPSAQNAGRVWYNTTSNTWKLVKGPQAIGTDGSWASGNVIPTPRSQSKAAGGPAGAIIFGGGGSTGGPAGVITNQFDGTCWSTVNSMVTVMQNCGGSGSEGDAVGAGAAAASQTSCEDWDGTCWAVANSLNTGRGNCGPIIGPGSAAQCNDGPSAGGATEQWDGTCWTTVPGTTLNTYQERMGFGTQAACVEAGGEGNPTAAEEWDGTSWTVGGALNTGRGNSSATGGTQTAGIVCCGGPSPSPAGTQQSEGTESYDGSTWTVCEEVTQPHGGGAVGGGESTASSQSAMYVAGGYTPAGPPGFHWYDETDQWTFDEYAVKAITTS